MKQATAITLGTVAAVLLALAVRRMRWPVVGTITSRFRSPERPTHNGVDIAAPVGTPVLAPDAGTVLEKYWHADGGNSLVVMLDNGDRLGFAHLSGFNVVPAQRFDASDVLGYTGATGNARGAHLHLTVKRGGDFIDPESVFT